MIKHHLKITFRNFKKNKTSFLINLIGLSTGLACALLIYLWVNDEVNINKFHENDSQLYQVMNNYQSAQEISTWDITSILLAKALAEEFPEVDAAATVCSEEERPSGILSKGEKNLKVNGIFTSENYFDFFSFPILKGNVQQVLNDKNNIVISENLAIKLFSSIENVVGQTIEWNNNQEKKPFVISGIFKNLPANSTKQFDFAWHIDLLTDLDEHAGKWNASYAETFLFLKPNTNINQFNNRIAKFLTTKHSKSDRSNLFVQQFSKKYLHGKYENGVQSGGRITYVRLFSIIAIFILLIACINFINLSTAQASTKMKEIGVKKTIGADRKALVFQFLTESTVIVFLSLFVALFFVNLLLPTFNEITGKFLFVPFDFRFTSILIGVVLITGLISGSYPAFYLSSFKPVMVLKGKRITSFGEQWIRKGLVVFQFALSVIFMVGVLVISKQMEFIQNKNLGFNRDNIITFTRANYTGDPEVFLTELKNISGVEMASKMSYNILDGKMDQGGYSWRGQESDKNYIFKSPIIGVDAIETLGIDLLSGRTFSKDFKEERAKIIINESARKMMNLKNPIGQKIGYGKREREIIGVVNDFHYGSIHHKIQPLIFRFSTRARDILVKIKGGSEKTTIAQIETLYKKFHPKFPFEFSFLDADYQALYESESKVADLSKYFSILAIIISCLGLFGLAMFTSERRKKEIGIRKVLGSSSFGIVKMLTSDFTKTVIIAILIAIPFSYFVAKSWLGNFAYGIDLKGWLFIVPAVLVLLVAWGTVGLQTFKAAMVNPVESLKDE